MEGKAILAVLRGNSPPAPNPAPRHPARRAKVVTDFMEGLKP